MEMTMHTALPVIESSQPFAVRIAAREVADRVGFSETDSYRVGLVATELATNLVKHARGGEILLRADDGARPQVELIALDRGPGMENVSAALIDGHSTAGTAGIGLGAVSRLSDEFDIHSCMPQGTAVLARFRPGRSAAAQPCPFVVAGVSIAKAGETECGDAWTAEYGRDGVVVLVADGLGHGHFAATAAAAVVQIFRDRAFENCAEALTAVHQSVRHTRGAAAGVIHISQRLRQMKFAGIGNVAASVLADGSSRQAVSHNGTLGHEARMFREYSYPWPIAALFVMHSDGLLSHWSLNGYPGLRTRHPAIVAAVLYRDFNRGRDDATVVVGREAA
jgi:anti-sigma regulatory factor (Ser/Thr protein kinase)